MDDGWADGIPWVGIFRLKDGRFLFALGWQDYSGWDGRAGNKLEVANSLDEILKYPFMDEYRHRLKFSQE